MLYAVITQQFGRSRYRAAGCSTGAFLMWGRRNRIASWSPKDLS